MFDFSKAIDAQQNMLEGAGAAMAAEYLTAQEPLVAMGSVQAVLPEVMRIPYLPGHNVSVRVWRGNTYGMVIAFGGLGLANDALGFLQGAASMTDIVGFKGSFNRMAARWFDNVYTSVRNTVTQGTTKVWLFGHSMGSTQALLCAKGIKGAFPNMEVQAITFGSPSWCDVTAANDLADLCVARVMNVGDIVPFIIPRIEAAPFLYAGLSNFGLASLAFHCHLPRGMTLSAGGVMTAQEDPPELSTAFDWNPANVSFALRGHIPGHDPAEYVARLQRVPPLGIFEGECPVHNVPAVVPPERRPPVRPARELRQIVQNPLLFANRPVLQPFVEAGAGRIKVKRDGTLTYVMIDGRLMYVGQSHRDAVAVARAARRMMLQYVQNPNNFMGPGSLDEMFLGEFGEPVDAGDEV